MDNEGFPAVVIDRQELRDNTKQIVEWCSDFGIKIAGVIKGAGGMVEVAKDMEASGAELIASSRIEQLERCKDGGIKVPLLLIRIPMLSEITRVVKSVDVSLNGDVTVLKALNDEALVQGKKHKVILMADLGDLREGFFEFQDLMDAALLVEKKLDNLILAGLGTNLGCYGSVMPTQDKMERLAELAEAIEKEVGHKLEYVSGGATSSLMGVFDNFMPHKVNMLRIGAGILCGPFEDMKCNYGYNQMDALHDDVFILKAEVVEVRAKPTHPIGKLGVDAFGNRNEYVDRGIRKRVLLGVGRADYGDITDLEPYDADTEIIGASGDHTIVDIEDSKKEYKIGDIMQFKLRYSAILRLMGSENVKVTERSK